MPPTISVVVVVVVQQSMSGFPQSRRKPGRSKVLEDNGDDGVVEIASNPTLCTGRTNYLSVWQRFLKGQVKMGTNCVVIHAA